MKKFMLAITVVAVATSLAPANAAEPSRTVTGPILAPTFRITQIPSVALPVVGNPSTSNGVYFRQARCAYVIAREGGDGNVGNGVFGYVVELDPSEGTGQHSFDVSTSAGNVSLQFYEDLGTCENQPAATTSAEPGGLFDTEGGEEGDIPFFARYAILVVEDANQVDFTFNVYEKEVA